MSKDTLYIDEDIDNVYLDDDYWFARWMIEQAQQGRINI